MIIGNGQLAQVFNSSDRVDRVIFASGVSNSNCVDKQAFQREQKLLISTLEKYSNKKFVYFSSCALSAPEYPKNDYYRHKQAMEKLIQTYSSNYYIFRIPQLFGSLKEHKTLINFIYYSIVNNLPFNVYTHAYRYVIEINDVHDLVEAYLNCNAPNVIVDISNNYRYKVEEIVHVLEELLHKQANCSYIDKTDEYTLDLSILEQFIKEHHLSLSFGKDYLKTKLKEKVKELHIENTNV